MATPESPFPAPWPALRAARHTTIPRRPVVLQGPRGAVPVGSVAESHLPALAAWSDWIDVSPHAVILHFGGDVDCLTMEVVRGPKENGHRPAILLR